MAKSNTPKPLKIVVTGPEATGKTNISDYLARHFNASWIPEYARYYISSLRERYGYADIESIAKRQIADYHRYALSAEKIVIFDTWLIITKVWFQEVFRRYPAWIDEEIGNLPMDHYLLCSPDIPWEPDDVRENGGERRWYLFEKYRKELEHWGFRYDIIEGNGQERFDRAVRAVDNVLKSEQ